MIRLLRRYHFRIWLVLTACVWALFVAGLAVRRPAAPLNPDLHWERNR